MSTLDDLASRGLIEAVEADHVTATKWLQDAERHLDAAQRIADLDPSGAYVLAYDAARKSVAAALLTTGHRVRTRPGAHQALARYATSLTTRTGEPALGASTDSAATETDPNTGRGHSARPRCQKPSTPHKRSTPPAPSSSDRRPQPSTTQRSNRTGGGERPPSTGDIG